MVDAYLLTVSHTDFRSRRENWKNRKIGGVRPAPDIKVLGTAQRPEDAPGGLLLKVDARGNVDKALPLWGPEGLLVRPDGLWVACPWDIKLVDHEVTHARTIVSSGGATTCIP
jgi:hypothetical protein